MNFTVYAVFNYWAGPCKDENAEQLKSMKAVGREQERERKRGGIGMTDKGK